MIALRRGVSAALLVTVLGATARIAHADCPEGTPQGACMLHEEGVALLASARYEQAATKFREAIAAAPSARSYLGYSQAVEGQGKLALAYEAILAAQRLSKEELANAGAADPEQLGRAERIKSRLGELGGRIGFVWLRLPENVPPQRLVSIHREDEDALPSPLGRWIPVAPDKQVLIATLDDGSQVQLVAQVVAGSERSLAIPIGAPADPAPPRPSAAPPPRPSPAPGPSPAPVPTPPVQPPLPCTTVAFGMTILSHGPEVGSLSLGAGIGLFGLFEQSAGKSLGLTARADYLSHPTDNTTMGVFSGSELMALAGLRTMTRTVHARIEAGVTRSTIKALANGGPGPGLPLHTVSWTDLYPVIGIGGGLHIGGVRLHASILYTANFAAVRDSMGFPFQIPIRFMGVVGFDLWRRL